MPLRYYDPMFCLTSEKMPFSICVRVTLKERVKTEALAEALEKAIPRYPYFAVRVVREKNEYITVPNPLPIVIYEGDEPLPFGGKELNYHLFALSVSGATLCFHMSHVLTDGCGFFPFIKTILYYYFCASHHTVLDPAGIRLADAPFEEDELGNPFPEAAMAKAKALYEPPEKPYFRLTDGGYVTDRNATVYRLRISEAEMMRFSFDHDGSPCAFISALLAAAIRDVHPEEERDIVSAISLNMRPALGNRGSYRMLCSSLPIRYPVRLRGASMQKLCTCTRGMITLQSQKENVLAMAQKRRERMEKLLEIDDLARKKEILSKEALADSIANTFSISYVGQMGLGAMEPFIDSIYSLTDGSLYQTVFIEVSAVNGWFDIAFQQGFSSDVYYRAFLARLEACDLYFLEEPPIPFGTAQILLPE